MKIQTFTKCTNLFTAFEWLFIFLVFPSSFCLYVHIDVEVFTDTMSELVITVSVIAEADQISPFKHY